MKKLKKRFPCIFFDADDTLWENEQFFRDAEDKFAALLSGYSEAEGLQQLLWAKQEDNIPLYGYGSKTYLIGMTDAAMELCGGQLPERIYLGIKEIIKNLAYHEFQLLEGVKETLEALSPHFKMVVATKGDVMEQMNKYRNSGLEKYFHHIEVMENKDEVNYRMLAAKNDIAPEDLLMVGNSVKSDIAPVVNIGGTAIHVPHEIVWVHELMDMPEHENIICVEDIREIPGLLL